MPRHGRDRLVCAAAILVVVGIVAACGAVSLLRPSAASATLTERPVVSAASSGTVDCERSVVGMVGLVPDAWGYGLLAGVSDTELRKRYGDDSREVATFDRVQQEILTFFRLHGLVRISDVLTVARAAVHVGCAAPR